MLFRVLFFVMSFFALCFSVQAQTFPSPPEKGQFFLDEAAMIMPEDEIQIQSISHNLNAEHRVPIFVVTIPSLARYKASHMSIEDYSRALFDEWGIGSKYRNYGMLLLVSNGDRKVRIELGADWKGQHDANAKYVIDEIIVPHFKDEYFSEGVRAGVTGMDAMARGLALPSPYLPNWVLPLLVAGAFISLCICTSFLKDGKKGFGWLFLSICVAIILFIFKAITTVQAGSDGLDGGFGGGGGATGDW